MHGILIGILLAAALAGCGACSSTYSISDEDAEAYAEARCAAAQTCCEPPPPEDCIASRSEALLHFETDSRLSFSESCMRDVLSWAANGIACETSLALESPECQLVHGEREKGEDCIAFGDLGFYGTDCAEGLECRDGRCASGPWVTFEAPVGDPCDLPGWTCVSGAYCSADGVCEAGVAAGQPCADAHACVPAAEYHCAGIATGAGLCEARPSLGEPCAEPEDACAFDCSDHACEKLRCADGICSPRLPAACEDLVAAQ